jgi:hypothetical protein
MIHFERVRLPRGTRAFAHLEDGVIVVYVSMELSARERLAAIRQALRAAPEAGWRAPRSPVLFPALAGSLGLRRAPEGRWAYRTVAVAAVVAVLVAVTALTAVSLPPGRPGHPAALQPGKPLLTGPGPAASQPAAGQAPGHQPGARAGSPSAPRGAAPGPAPQPGKTTTTSSGGPVPAPESSGTPAPVPTISPTSQPSQTPSPSPAKQSSGSGSCVDLLGITLCL